MPSSFYPGSVEFFQLHEGMVIHMYVLATPTSTVNNTKILNPYHRNHITFGCLFLRQWCRDLASGADRNLDITFGLKVHSLFLYFLEKHLAIPTSPFFIY